MLKFGGTLALWPRDLIPPSGTFSICDGEGTTFNHLSLLHAFVEKVPQRGG